MELSTPQKVLLRRIDQRKLYRSDDGDFWLHPREPHHLPEPVFPGDVQPLISAGLLIEGGQSQWLGQQFVRAEQESQR